MFSTAPSSRTSTFPGIWRHSLLLASLIAALPAQASESPPSVTSADEFDSIVITARRRKEKAQDVPAAISSVRGRNLEAQRLDQLTDLSQALPGLSVTSPGASGLSIRGSSAAGSAAGGVALYVDNVYVGAAGDYAAELLDIEQVDLLRGPQVLAGQNNSAGVLHLSTRLPSFDAQGNAAIAMANAGFRQIKASYTAPVSEQFAVRIAGYGSREDNAIKIINQDTTQQTRQGLRLQGWLAGSNDFQLRLIAEHHQQDEDGPAALLYRGDKQLEQTQQDAVSERRRQQSALSAEAGWLLASRHRLTSISAWRDSRDNGRSDLDGGPLASARDASQRHEQSISQEFRLSSPEGEDIEYVLGAFWQKQHTDFDRQITTGKQIGTMAGVWPDNAQIEASHRTKRNIGSVFGQATLHLSRLLDLTAGAHLSRETQSASLSQWWPGSALAAKTARDLSQSQNNRTASLAASYKLTEHMLLYANLARGQSGAGLALANLPLAGDLPSSDQARIAPETSKNLELGLKTTWLNNRLYLNASAFFNRIGGYQAWQNQQTAGRELVVLANAGDVTSRGIEIDMKAKAADGLTLAVNASWNDTRFDNGKVAAAGTSGNIDASGRRVAAVPRLSLNSQMQYHWTLPDNVEPYLNASYLWRSEREGDASNATDLKLAAYGVLNLSAGLRATRIYSRWDASIWLKNAADTRYVQALGRVNQAYFATPGQRRMVGASLSYDF